MTGHEEVIVKVDPLDVTDASVLIARTPAGANLSADHLHQVADTLRLHFERNLVLVMEGGMDFEAVDPATLPVELARRIADAYDAALVSNEMLRYYTDTALELSELRAALDAYRERSLWRRLLGLKPRSVST